jgi:transcription antitermination factor NusG
MAEENNWYAIYTKPRAEKKVFELLHDRGIHAYCPLNKVRKKWSDRYKVVEEPLFTSYVFVKIAVKDFSLVKQISGVLNFVYWCGEPAIIKEEEVERVKSFLAEYPSVEVLPLEIHKGEIVEVAKGVFMGEEGMVIDVDKKYITILLNTLGYAVRAKLPAVYIKTK